MREERHSRNYSGSHLQAGAGGLTGSGRIGGRERGAVMPLPVHLLQLFLGHPKIVPQFMYESPANLMTHFGLA
jgi:hypothetical protein